MLRYNPFATAYDAITPEQLAILRDVSEGWYVEYKREVSNVASIAKSISAFANHYGGWLFYGIAQANDGSNRAGSFGGLPTDHIPRHVEQVQNAVRTFIHPPPFYLLRVLSGPCPPIGLAADHSIIMIQVPVGSTAPYIHGSGRIYRRVADASDPKPETDRAVLDQLWERGRRSRDRLAEFLETEPELSEGEAEISIVRLFLMSDPLGDLGHRSLIDFEAFAQIMKSTNPNVADFPCDNVFSSADGYVARQVGRSSPFGVVLTWQHLHNGASIVTVPLRSAKIEDLATPLLLQHYILGTMFLNICHSAKLGFAHLLDTNLLLATLQATLVKHHRLLKASRIAGPFYWKAQLLNVWRRIPFLDTSAFVTAIKQHGLPVIQESGCYAPAGVEPGSLIKVQLGEDAESTGEGVLGAAVSLFFQIASALGIANTIIGASAEELAYASNRGIMAHQGET